VLVLLVLAYAVLAVIWWYDAPLINALFDASRNLISRAAAAIDPLGRLELVLRSLAVARHLVVACLMLALALAWEILKWMGRGARARLTAQSAQGAQ
jgi:ABC-type spermidine/putrescine transport system permease subunit I